LGISVHLKRGIPSENDKETPPGRVAEGKRRPRAPVRGDTAP